MEKKKKKHYCQKATLETVNPKWKCSSKSAKCIVHILFLLLEGDTVVRDTVEKSFYVTLIRVNKKGRMMSDKVFSRMESTGSCLKHGE